jgi:hypothetical protein
VLSNENHLRGDHFKARQGFAIEGDPFIANLLTQFSERIEGSLPAAGIAPGIATFLERLPDYAVFRSVLRFQFVVGGGLS